MENRCRKTHHFLVNNQFYLHDIKVNTQTFSIDSFYQEVSIWEPCDCRGRPHIESMKLDIQNGYKIPPVVHDMERGFSSPIDGRHRTIAVKELGYDFVESISMEYIMEQVKSIKENEL